MAASPAATAMGEMEGCASSRLPVGSVAAPHFCSHHAFSRTRAGLKKKSPKKTTAKKAIDAWQKRYFVLTGGSLSYYKTEKAAHLSNGESLKAISLEQVLCATVNPRTPDAFVIDLGQERKVKLQAASEAERDAWVSAIEAAKRKLLHENSPDNVMALDGRATIGTACSAGASAASARPYNTPARDTELVAAVGDRLATPELNDIRLLRSGGRDFGASAGCCIVM